MGMRKQSRQYRIFDVDQAKAGAPYGLWLHQGNATIHHYDERYIIGMIDLGGGAVPASWNLKGEGSHPLCMLPIATCQDKPVYVGDTLYDANGERFEVEVGHTASMLKECSWDAPVKKVETRMTDIELGQAYNNNGSTLKAVANAAIARAIADGDVVPMADMEKIINIAANFFVNFQSNPTAPVTLDKIMDAYRSKK
jgi:hypothetical protein